MVDSERRRIDAFELWCWRRLLRVPWTARRSNQSILKVISPGISLEGMMLKLKLQYLGHLMQRVDSLEKTLMLGGIGGKRRRGRQRMRWLDGITDSMDDGWLDGSFLYDVLHHSLSTHYILLIPTNLSKEIYYQISSRSLSLISAIFWLPIALTVCTIDFVLFFFFLTKLIYLF